ncbi:histidine phosphatase family protein [Streptomyces odontomachi]|uniref:histidine phosphatase family protein n=1 Tax=Streptomyces odontomachi TaxID=2944940 RepID=UPI0021097EE0|nr:histidine phosphatase family protein [Streptomyces sp. ODS25]
MPTPQVSPARLLLVRHGETVWHAENRYAGISDVALTERGLRQADDLAGWAAQRGVDAVACSPLSRARRTAQPTADLLGHPLEVIPELCEVDFGWGEGRTIDEMIAEDPEAVRRFRADAETGAFPGAEPPSAAAARASAALRALAARHPGRTVLVVAHNTLVRITLCGMLGIPLGRYRQVLPRLDNAAVTEIEVAGERTALRSLNVPTGRPDPAGGTDPAAGGAKETNRPQRAHQSRETHSTT